MARQNNEQSFNTARFHDAVDRNSQIGISFLAATQQVLIENLGGLALYTIDVLFGGLALALTTGQHLSQFKFSLLLIISTLLGLATTAIQYRLWRIVIRTENWMERWPHILAGGVIALLDTFIDGSLVEWFLGGKPANWPRPIAGMTPMYWMIWGTIILVCGLNEPLIELFKNQAYRQTMSRSTRTATPQTQSRPQNQTNNRSRTSYSPHSTCDTSKHRSGFIK